MRDVDELVRDELRSAADRFEPDPSISPANVHHRVRVLRTQVFVWVLIVALVGVSSVFISLRATGSDQSGSFVGPRPSTGQDPHIIAARAETVWLLNRFRPPADAARVEKAPSAIIAIGPPTEPGSPHFLFTSRFWRVAQPFDSLNALMSTTLPKGLVRANWSGSGGGPGYTTADFAFDDPRRSDAYEKAELMITIVSMSTNVTGLRVDGTAVWLTSEPLQDTSAGPRIRVPIFNGCPETLGKFVDVRNNPSSELGHRLLPSAKPVAGLKCLYRPAAADQSGPLKLKTQTRLGPAAAQELQRQINGLPVGWAGPVAMSCPFYRATELLVFQYADYSEVDLWHSMNCGGVYYNGSIVVFG